MSGRHRAVVRIDIRNEITDQHVLYRAGLDFRIGHIAVYVPSYWHSLRGDDDDRVRPGYRSPSLNAGLVDVGSYSACIVDKENQRIPYGRVKIGREVQVIRQDLSGKGTDEFFLPFVVLMSAV